MTLGGDRGLNWQIGVWDAMAEVYLREIDRRFEPIVGHLLTRAELRPGQRVLDLGTGTGSVALSCAPRVAPEGRVIGFDISPEMLALARERAGRAGLANVSFAEGRAEAIPADDSSQDTILASLSLMYVIDRAAAAREIARVLKPGGRLVAAVWAGPEHADIVRLQQMAGSCAPEPPVAGVGPGAMADPSPFLAQLAAAGIAASAESEITEFDFADFASAWAVLAGVTAARIEPERLEPAKTAVRAVLWPDGDGPRRFRNETQFIIGVRGA
jgi:SAM-dependent methyltransferase